MNRKYDWTAIQDYYDEGHSLQECKAKFGFANGAWDAAVGRGEVVPRATKEPRFRHDTREVVLRLFETGMSQTEIAFELGLSKGTVCYHVRQLGLAGDARFRRRYDWDEIQRAHDSGKSMRECQCQRPSVSPQLRPSVLPTGGHVFSPLVAIGSPHYVGCAAVVAEPSP